MTLNAQKLESMALTLTRRMSAVVARMAKLKAALAFEQSELQQYAQEIDECMDRMDEIDGFAVEMHMTEISALEDEETDAEEEEARAVDCRNEMAELEGERNEEIQLLERMMRAHAAHELVYRKLAAQYLLMRRELERLQRKERVLVVLAMRLGVVKLSRRRKLM